MVPGTIGAKGEPRRRGEALVDHRNLANNHEWWAGKLAPDELLQAAAEFKIAGTYYETPNPLSGFLPGGRTLGRSIRVLLNRWYLKRARLGPPGGIAMAFPVQRENILALTSHRLIVFAPVLGSASLLVPGRPGEPLFEIDRRNVVCIKPGKRRRLMKTIVVEFGDGSSIGLTTLKGADRLLFCDDDNTTFAPDAEMKARGALADEFFAATNPPEMDPWVSDWATWYDFDYLDDAELHTAVQKHYGVDFDDETLRQPFWKFLDYLEANRTIRNQQESR